MEPPPAALNTLPVPRPSMNRCPMTAAFSDVASSVWAFPPLPAAADRWGRAARSRMKPGSLPYVLLYFSESATRWHVVTLSTWMRKMSPTANALVQPVSNRPYQQPLCHCGKISRGPRFNKRFPASSTKWLICPQSRQDGSGGRRLAFQAPAHEAQSPDAGRQKRKCRREGHLRWNRG